MLHVRGVGGGRGVPRETPAYTVRHCCVCSCCVCRSRTCVYCTVPHTHTHFRTYSIFQSFWSAHMLWGTVMYAHALSFWKGFVGSGCDEAGPFEFLNKLNTLCRHHVLTPAIIKTQYGPAAWETLVGRDEMWRSLDFNAKASAVGSSGNLWRGNFFLSFLNLLTFRKLYCLCYILKIANQVWSLCVKQCHKNMTWTVVLKQFFFDIMCF